jgi:hypothetical protein
MVIKTSRATVPLSSKNYVLSKEDEEGYGRSKLKDMGIMQALH